MTAGPPEFLKACLGLCFGPLDGSPPARKPAEKKAEEVKKPERKTTWRSNPLVNQYHLVKQIGKGGFSEIWLGEHKESGQQVAVKVVDLKNEDLEPSEVANLIAEAKFLRTMDCPFLLKCLDTAHDDEWLVLVLEYLSGGEMLAHLHKVKKYTEVEAAKLFAQVVSAISYLHNLNLMHRDIKPENVMFTQPVETFEAEGKPLRVKVIDMGMSALYDPDKEVRGCIGTPGFVSPEIWNDAPHTPAGDVYALGVMLFIMLTGRKPFGGMDIRMMTYCNKPFAEAPGLQDERYLNLSAEAKDLLLKMLADDPKARPTCLEVLKHPFMTADESTAAAHREMGDLVRNRMRDLAQLRRVHGLQYALRLAKRQGADKQSFLNALEQRRLKLTEASVQRSHDSNHGVSANHTPQHADSGAATGPSPLSRYSLAQSYATTPASAPAGVTHHARGGASGAGSRAEEVTTISVGNPLSSSSSAAQEAALALPASRPPVPPIASSSGQHVKPLSAAHLALAADVGPAVVLSPRDSAFGHASLPPLPGALVSRAGTAAGMSFANAKGNSESANGTPEKASVEMGAAVHADKDLKARSGVPPRPPAHAHYPAFSQTSAPPGESGAVPGHGLAGSKEGSGRHGSHNHRRGLSNVTADSSHGPAHSHHPSVDPFAIVNAALPPTLQHCNSMPVADAVLGVGMGLGLNDDGERVGGGSPVATMEVLEQAHMVRCMSVNPLLMDMLQHADTIDAVLAQAAAAHLPLNLGMEQQPKAHS
ncbi:hypothetical protein HYH02_006472 [Chlamydomonas schloesseri]|uniref:Protein kinase domain-containing protein n=1 Tax=Chlamydomonas schloesseri TaxID=2026947 RepID=A0A836B5X0_9CHLO|nr:hypothetical protein HYH02_006472 [Chlamydomonas schloesseri]|eukprot:KAG2448581.1 hypothetical protein HYH02_006472 [Chlamydomonas schloesseri]